MRGLIHYLDGVARAPDDVAVVSAYQREEYGNGQPTMVDFFRAGSRTRVPVDGEIVSAGVNADGSVTLLGRLGEAFRGGPDRLERSIVSPQKPLSLTRVRCIGDTEYA
jgi:hypothetical protein